MNFYEMWIRGRLLRLVSLILDFYIHGNGGVCISNQKFRFQILNLSCMFASVQIFPYQNYEAFKYRSLFSSTKTPLHKLVSDYFHEFYLNLHYKPCRYIGWTLMNT